MTDNRPFSQNAALHAALTAARPVEARNSSTRMAAETQDKPSGDGQPVLDAVLNHLTNMSSVSSIPFAAVRPLREDLMARAENGLKKYGTKLRVRNGRRAIVDCYQELLDALMYAMQARLEGDREAGRLVEILMSLSAQVAIELNKR